MRHETMLCLDVETIPDPDLIPADWPPEKFVPKAIWHKVVAVSFVEASILPGSAGGERYEVRCCRSGGEAGWDERRLLQAFWAYFASLRPRVVSWNGRSFDLPVLRLRAMMYGIAADAWFTAGDRWNGYVYRYAADWHCDLMEQISDHGAATKLGMQDVAVAMGLPGKLGGHGSEVAAMVQRGELGAVRAYCEIDVVNLFALYVRWALLTGKTDAAGHNASMDSLAACLEAGRAERRHFGEFLDLWRRSGRPMPSTVPVARCRTEAAVA
ncbi:3'-5' exonuclease [Methylobacterium sp. GXS13]|jgi:predicted PolB exonuclease-like 3'-5' exonuclease|uniref:3'-5' exonuclease n=1 Tax=unclassified Methylobacterium TaxID=2615210 RepID=UPI00071B1C3D|nr:MULTISPECIES: 3'-5' exonuclease [unclassified Methylobacterium]KST59981.1 3'-5' exonuclease [Methylobacterium sp. GXS13]MCJ2102297.1 3'-5' exonuclease [Methylobacterium sp. E-046]TXM95515.1 3'-5' exonuclease [Methylobacterium sp. WL116]